jgi:DNA-directed RNA polymerase
MTVVYGVTVYGGRLQVERQLEDDVSDDLIKGSSKYIVNLIFEVLRDMFSSARELQDWLTNSARQISGAGCLTEWVTPLGLPVVQPYTKRHKITVKTPLQTLSSYSLHSSQVPSKAKQKNGFPPNFIHSLDSTHMMLTALHCQRAGITFAAVHDSFWTHASTVDTMNKICREQFVALHEEPIIEDLSESFEKKFGGLRYKSSKEEKMCSFNTHLPSKGDLDIHQVIHSQYFFS